MFLNKFLVPQFRYFLDLCPHDYFLSLKVKTRLYDCPLGIVENMQQVLTSQLKAVSVEEFQHYFPE